MRNRSLVKYSPERHAGFAPKYAGTHVVETEVRLSDVTFRPEDDEIAKYVGPRDADSCPVDRENLVAKAHTPQIKGGERRQHLTAGC
jgi:hypothetical protein